MPKMMNAKRKRQVVHANPTLMYGVTAPVTAKAFLVGQLGYLRDHGWTVDLVCGDNGLVDFARKEGVRNLNVVCASRTPSVKDLQITLRLWLLLRSTAPEGTIFGTPKFGVFGTVAACLARVPFRCYLIHGYRAESMTGAGRVVIKALDKLACLAATDVVAVSESLKARLVEDRVVSASKVFVIGHGSANGVDTERFRPAKDHEKRGARDTMGVPATALVVSFVGRLTKDKGIVDLCTLSEIFRQRMPTVHFLIAGPNETVDSDDSRALKKLSSLPNVTMLGEVRDVTPVYHAADVLVMLSRREGLGMVVLEAAGCGVPTVAYEATGVIDAIDPGAGVIVPMGDVNGFQKALEEVLQNSERRAEMGEKARHRVLAKFAQESVWSGFETWLRARLDARIAPAEVTTA